MLAMLAAPSDAHQRRRRQRQQRLRLLAGAAAAIGASACFLSSPSSSPSSSVRGENGLFFSGTKMSSSKRRVLSALDSDEPYGVLRDDGTLFVPVGDQTPNHKGIRDRDGQNLKDKVPGTRHNLCQDLMEDLHALHLKAEEERSEESEHEPRNQENSDDSSTSSGANRKFTRLHVEADICGDHSVGDVLPEYFRYNLLAHLAKLPFTFSCKESLPGTIFDLLQKDHEWRDPNVDTINGDFGDVDPDYTLKDSCHSTSISADLSHALLMMGNNLRRIAFDPSLQSAVEADDAVIHLRLNDVLKAELGATQDRPSLRGLFAHSTYSKLLRKAEEEKSFALTSISIVTQINDVDSVRRDDKPYVERSVEIANDLAQYLRTEFHAATVTVRNDWRTESTATSYARIVRADKVVICGRSGFCLYPSLAVRDDVLAYLFYRPDHPSDKNLLIKAAHEEMDNVRLWDAPYLGNNQIEFMAGEHVDAFLRNDTAASRAEVSIM